MRTKRSLFNIAAQGLYQGMRIVTGLILPRLLLTHYGSMINGLVTSIRHLLQNLRYLRLGLNQAAVLSLYKPLADRDDEKISRVLSTTRKQFWRIGLYFSIGATLLAFGYPLLVDHEGLSRYYVTTIVLLLATSGAAGFFLLAGAQVLLFASQRNYVISISSSAMGGASLVVIVVLILSGADVVVVPIVSTTAIVLNAVLLHWYIRREFGNRLRFDLPPEPGLIKQRWSVAVTEISNLIQRSVPIIIVTVVLGLMAMSVYAVFNMVFRALHSATRLLPRALQASFGELHAQGRMQRFRAAYSEYEFLVYLVTGWLYVSAGILLMPFIRIYTRNVTDTNYIQPLLGAYFITLGVARQLAVPCSTAVAACGRFRETRGINIVVASIGVTLSLLGAFAWGLEGVLAGATTAALVKAGYLIQYTYRHVLEVSMVRVLGRIVRNAVFCSIVVLPFVFLLHIQLSSFWIWCVWATGVFAWAGLILIVGNALSDFRTTVALLQRTRSVARRQER